MPKQNFSLSGWLGDNVLWPLLGYIALLIAAVATVDMSANSDGYEIE